MGSGLTPLVSVGYFAIDRLGAVALLGTILLIRWPSHLAEFVLPRWSPTPLTGSPLAADEFYPVSVEPDWDPYLDIEKFTVAVAHLLQDRDERAASDLIYLELGNNVER